MNNLKNKVGHLSLTVVGLMSSILISCSSNRSSLIGHSSSSSSYDRTIYHTVVWFNYDNSLLYRDTKVEEGTIPVFKGDTPVRPSNAQYTYTFNGWSPTVVPAYIDANYVASFLETVNQYTITWKDEDGSVLLEEKYDYGETPTYYSWIADKRVEGYSCYSFKGWVPEVSTVTKDATYVASYNKELINYNIYYDLGGGTNSSLNPSTYTINDSVYLRNPTREGYKFDGWFDFDGNKITVVKYIPDTSGEYALFAHWSPIKNTLTITSNDNSKGTVAVVNGSGYSDESITVQATPKEDYAFDGWYDGIYKLSGDANYTFSMPVHNYSLTGRFVTKEEHRKNSLGITPVIDYLHNTITYGLYPQTHVSDESLIESLNLLTTTSLNNWYLFEDRYYAKMKIKDEISRSQKFENGEYVRAGNTYWFECQPINWIILKNDNGEYTLISEKLLDVKTRWHRTVIENPASDYVYSRSSMRSWLNADFYDTAFSLNSEAIQVKHVDNSLESTSASNGTYTGQDTDDKVYLLSYKEWSLSYRKYIFCERTDWIHAFNANDANSECSGYWTRSIDSSKNVWCVLNNSQYPYYFVPTAEKNVRPAITIRIDK